MNIRTKPIIGAFAVAPLVRVVRRSVALAPLLWFAALLVPPAHAAQETPADLMVVQQGSLPIILTVPHGGREAIPGIAPRNLEGKSRGRKWNGFVGRSDANTDILAQRIAAEIKALTGRDVYLVMAKFQRKFVDVNRRRRWRSMTLGPVPTTTITTTRFATSSTRYAKPTRLAC
jgi:N-formylglutamate amidohydrolase